LSWQQDEEQSILPIIEKLNKYFETKVILHYLDGQQGISLHGQDIHEL
jgi:hypothetical protein